MNFRLSVLVVISVISAASVQAGDWPTWRGPTGDGVAADGDYATSWTATEHVQWKVALGGRGASTPIVTGDRILLTYGHEGKNVLLCLDRSGKQQWSVELGEERGGKHKKASGSNPSCVTDGKVVFAYFKSGDIAAVDLNGTTRWHHNVQTLYGEDSLWWDLGTSPVLTDSAVVVTVMQTGPSYLAAFDKESGKVAWKSDRSVPAPVEAAQSYTTPIVATVDGSQRIYIVGADHATAHDAKDGRELWRVGGLNPGQNEYFRSISSPVLAGDLLIAPYARGSSVTGIRLGGSGDVTKSHVAWTAAEMGADVPTPTVKGDRVYICRDRGEISVLDRRTGKVIEATELPKYRSNYSSSPVLAGDLLYVTREDGHTFVLNIADGLKVVGEGTLNDEFTVATPVLVDGQILIRTYDHLYCIGG